MHQMSMAPGAEGVDRSLTLYWTAKPSTTLERAKTRRLSARKRCELKSAGIEHDEKDETDDSMLDNSEEEEKNIWLRQETAAAKTKAILKKRKEKENQDFLD